MPITHVIADLVRQQTTTTGTGILSLGSVPSGCRGIIAGIGTGKRARYKLKASNEDWEIGLGTVTAGSPDTFSRDVVYASSAGGTTKITLPTGTHTLDVTFDAKSANEMTPRLLNIGNGVTLSSGTLSIDCMGSCDVVAVVVLTENVTSVSLNNVQERTAVELWVTHSGGPWAFPQASWPAGTVLQGAYNLYTDATVTRFWWTTTDAGASAILECNAPIPSGGVSDSDKGDIIVSGSGTIWTIDSDAVTNGKLSNMTAGTFKGRVSVGTGNPEDLTSVQARAMIEYAAPSAVTITTNTTLAKASHQGKVLYCTTGALSLTVDALTDFDAYASCEIVNKTGAVVTFVATATINRIGSKPLTLPANGRATLMREATADVYLLTGEMA